MNEYATSTPLAKPITSIFIDLESMYMSLALYRRASVPEFLYREINLESGLTFRWEK
jgi:hypothetical protein